MEIKKHACIFHHDVCCNRICIEIRFCTWGHISWNVECTTHYIKRFNRFHRIRIEKKQRCKGSHPTNINNHKSSSYCSIKVITSKKFSKGAASFGGGLIGPILPDHVHSDNKLVLHLSLAFLHHPLLGYPFGQLLQVSNANISGCLLFRYISVTSYNTNHIHRLQINKQIIKRSCHRSQHLQKTNLLSHSFHLIPNFLHTNIFIRTK